MAWNDPHWEQNRRIEKNDSSATYKPKGELLIIKLENEEKHKLTYVFNITTLKPYDGWRIYVDATNGKVLVKKNNIMRCGARSISFNSLYNGAQTTIGVRVGWFSPWVGLESCSNNINIITKDEDDNSVVNNTTNWGSYHQQYTSAHWALQRSWEYFRDVWGRNGWDGGQQQAKMRVFGASSTFIAGYQDATKAVLIDQNAMSLDIVAHEFTHGVNAHSSRLTGFGESGALNESFADIFGLLIRRHLTGTMNWRIGTGTSWGLMAANNFQPVERDFINPATSCCLPFQRPNAIRFGITDPNWIDPLSNDDEGGVHHNCGVQNRWFRLLAEGNAALNIQGIGIFNASRIAYGNLSFQLFANATFQDAANGSSQVAEDLFGCGSFEWEQNRRAWQAVNIQVPLPALTLSGNTSVCFDQFSGGTFNVEACWVFGANYTWSIQGTNNYSTSLYGSGNNILSVSIPSDATSEFITVSATGTVNGVQQTNSLQINVSDCGYYYMKQNNKINSKNQTISIYPNPAHEFLNLFLSNDLLQEDLNIEIYNTTGQKIKEILTNGLNSRIDIVNLQIGMYHLVVRDKSKIILFSKKFTKI